MTLYYQRIFAKLGYTVAPVLVALPLLQMLLDETEKDLVFQACPLYHDCEFFVIELQTLYHTIHTKLLYLFKLVLVSDQAALQEIIPKFYNINKLCNHDLNSQHIR